MLNKSHTIFIPLVNFLTNAKTNQATKITSLIILLIITPQLLIIYEQFKQELVHFTVHKPIILSQIIFLVKFLTFIIFDAFSTNPFREKLNARFNSSVLHLHCKQFGLVLSFQGFGSGLRFLIWPASGNWRRRVDGPFWARIKTRFRFRRATSTYWLFPGILLLLLLEGRGA
ncbi:hypothetical protein CICLE_v100237412mg, partial [Citrus x clementina]